MQTIEAAVLVPLGLGLVVILVMLTFWMHDRVVMAAECSSLVLEWQQTGKVKTEEGALGREWENRMLVTELSRVEISGGSAVLRLRMTAERELFRYGFLSAELGEPESGMTAEKTVIRTEPCWLKRIWRVSGFK